MLEMKMSDKFNCIYELNEVDNKEEIVKEIRALKNFKDDELASIFGSDSILWILENYSVRELKDKVKSVENNITISTGDVITFKLTTEHVIGVILEVTGLHKNRCTALCYYRDRGYFKIVEGISSFDIELADNYSSKDFASVLDALGVNQKGSINLKEGGDL